MVKASKKEGSVKEAVDNDDKHSVVSVSMRSANKKEVKEEKPVEEHPVMAQVREGSIVPSDKQSKKSKGSNKSIGSRINHSLRSGGKSLQQVVA